MTKRVCDSSPPTRASVATGNESAPGARLPSRALAISSSDLSANEIARRLRSSETPIIARVEEGRVLLDLRTVKPEQDEAVLTTVESMSS